MAEAVDIDVIHFEDKYDKADRIDEADLDESINELNRSIREQRKLENRIHRTEWSSMNEDERTKLEQQIAFNEKERGLYIMRASKAILLILHRGFILWHIKNMAEAVDIDVIHFEDKYDKADRIDEANLDESIN